MVVNIKLFRTVGRSAMAFVWEWKLDTFLTQHFDLVLNKNLYKSRFRICSFESHEITWHSSYKFFPR